jgi:toxin ParE1/3/4
LAEIDWTLEAEAWLKDIHDYIVVDNPEAAARTLEGIFERSQILKQYPEAGYKYETQSDRPVRILLYGHYRITYLMKADGNIDILGVFHGALDIDRYLV